MVNESVCKRVAGDIEISRLDVDVGGVGSEEVKIVESGIVLVGAAQANNDQADEGGDGQGHGREDARKTSGFPHDDGVASSQAMLRSIQGTSVGRRID